MLKKPSKTQTIGMIMIIPAILMSIYTIAFGYFWIGFGLEDVEVYGLTTYFSYSLIQLLLSFFGIYSGNRYIKNRPFAQNKPLGLLLILLGIIYFLSEFADVLISNISGFNPGGELRPIIAFDWGLILATLGWGLIAGFPPSRE